MFLQPIKYLSYLSLIFLLHFNGQLKIVTSEELNAAFEDIYPLEFGGEVKLQSPFLNTEDVVLLKSAGFESIRDEDLPGSWDYRIDGSMTTDLNQHIPT